MLMRRWILLLVLLLCSLSLSATTWVGHQAAMLVIFVHPHEESTANEIGIMAQEELSRLGGTVGLQDIQPFSIFAYNNRDEFLRDAGSSVFLLGVSYPPSGTIRVDVTGSQGPIRQVLAHEITHTLLGQRLGPYIGVLPIWVNEGIADYLSVPTDPATLPALAHQRPASGIMSVRDLDRAFLNHQQSGVAYAQSRSMMAWLEYKHPGALLKLLNGIAVGRHFDDALYHASGITTDQWLAQWTKGISLFEYWLSISASPVVYAPFALLLVIIAIWRLKRKRNEENIMDESTSTNEPVQYSRRSPSPPPGKRDVPVMRVRIISDLSHFPVLDDL